MFQSIADRRCPWPLLLYSEATRCTQPDCSLPTFFQKLDYVSRLFMYLSCMKSLVAMQLQRSKRLFSFKKYLLVSYRPIERVIQSKCKNYHCIADKGGCPTKGRPTNRTIIGFSGQNVFHF